MKIANIYHRRSSAFRYHVAGPAAVGSLRRNTQNAAAPTKQASSLDGQEGLLQPKTQAEYDAYKAASAQTDPAKLEAAATDFAQKFPDSELRRIPLPADHGTLSAGQQSWQNP